MIKYGWVSKYCINRKKPDLKDHILPGSIYMEGLPVEVESRLVVSWQSRREVLSANEQKKNLSMVMTMSNWIVLMYNSANLLIIIELCRYMSKFYVIFIILQYNSIYYKEEKLLWRRVMKIIIVKKWCGTWEYKQEWHIGEKVYKSKLFLSWT